MNVVLVFFKDDERRDFPLKERTSVIGRAPEAGLRIPLQDVSRKHCELVVTATGVTVRDLGSSNGTYVNGRRVAESPLDPGDVLEVGPVRFLVQIDGKPSTITPHDLKVHRQEADEPPKAAGPKPPSAAGPKTVTRAAPANASKPNAPAAAAKGAKDDAETELTEDDLFDLNDSDFDLNEASWPLDEDDDDKPKKGKK